MFHKSCWGMATAMALGVSVLGAPHTRDEAARKTGKGGTEVTHLVTGDPARINAVTAGTPPTAILAVTPVNPPSTVPDYPAGTTIVGNELRAPTGGFRAWFNVQMSDWDPLGNGPNLSLYQVKIDCTNYSGENADPPNPFVDLAPASVACPGDDPTPCVDAFGESWASCNGLGDGMCDAGYLDSAQGRPDSWCAISGGGCASFGVATGTCNYNYFAVSNAIPGHPDQSNTCVGGTRSGQGCRPANAAANCGGATLCTGPKLSSYYGGTLVLDIPAGAAGKYTIFLNPEETFVASPGTPPVVLESLEENGFVVNIVTGTTTVLEWESVITHTRAGQTDLVVPLLIPDTNAFSEPRSGVKKIVVTFDGALDPATAIPANMTICGNLGPGPNVTPVNLSGIVVSTATTSGDTKMEINFAPALPDFARYRVVLSTNIQGAGGGAIQAGAGGLSRILTALQGDSTGDRRVNATDVGGIRSLVPRDPINPGLLVEVRADINNDKRINATDVGGARSRVPNDARTIPDPVCP